MNTELINTFKAMELKLQILFNNMNEGVALHKLIFDKNGTAVNYIIEKVNPSYEKILSFKKEEVEGKTSTEVYGTSSPPYLQEFSKVALTGQPFYFEPYFEPFGKYYSISVCPWGENGFATIFSDITSRKKIEKELLLKNFVFNEAIAANSIADKKGIIIEANSAFLQIWGYSDISQVIGRPVSDFLKNENETIAIIKSLDKKGSWQGNYTALRSDGSTFIALSFATTIKDNDGNFLGYQSSVVDVTECKKKEEQIDELLKEKELLLKELHHRVSNSISAINSLLCFQAENINNPEASAILKDARNRLKSMGLLHKKLYKSETLQDCNAMDYFSQLIDEIMAVFPISDKIKIDKNIENIILPQKFLFPLGIIINELLTNAVKHAFAEVSKPYIKIDLTSKDNDLCLSIEDNGKGISDNEVNNAKGFGMSLVSLLAEQLKGELKIEKRKGCKFSLKFSIV